MKTNKMTNFILEISQVFLVFLGVYSAVMCATQSLAIPVNRLVTTLVLMGAAFLFYGLFTVLETFHRGKFYGMLGITMFCVLVVFRFYSVVSKGVVTICNVYLKELMNYTKSTVTLLSGKSFVGETASVGYCVTLVVILVAGYLIALVSSCFYRKRRSSVYIAATILFFFVPITIGKIGFFSNVVTYIFVSMAVLGTRFLRHDTTDKRMRQKLSLVLTAVGVAAAIVTWLFIPPERYANNRNEIVEVKNSALALTSWEREDIFTWFREYFNGDALEYGKVGRKNSVSRTGQTILKVSGDFDKNQSLYLKGYTGGNFTDNRWRQIKDESGGYEKEQQALASDGLSVDNWHVTLRNQIGDRQTTGNDKLWSAGMLKIRNLAFGYGNYLIPYYPTVAFSSTGGRMNVEVPGIEYEVEYFPYLETELTNGLMADSYQLAANEYWNSSQTNIERLAAFAKKYYLQIPETVSGVVETYKAYLNSQESLLERFERGEVPISRIIEETRNFIMNDTKYTLSPGKTPSDKDPIVYFLTENKKGYCTHYATAAAVLLRSVGIPTRYAEGVYISREKLADATGIGAELDITDKDIHSWVEVYQDYYGFVPVEFTPGIGEDSENSSMMDEDSQEGQQPQGDSAEDGSQEGQDGGAPEAPTPVPEEDMTFENIETDGYNREEEEPVSGGAVSESAVSTEDGAKANGSSGLRWWQILLLCLGVLLLGACLAEGQRRLRLILFKKKVKSSSYRRQVILYYHQLEHVLNQEGIRYQGQSVAAYTAEIAQAYGMQPEEIREFVEMIFCAVFSQDSFDKAEMIGFRKMYGHIRHQIYGEKNVIKKLFYLYVLVY